MDKAERIAWVLERLSEGFFHEEDSGEDEERIVFPVFGFSLDAAEEFFAEDLSEVDDVIEGTSPEGTEVSDWDNDSTRVFLQLFWQSHLGKTLAGEELSSYSEIFKDWERGRVLVWFYSLVRGYHLPGDEASTRDVRRLAGERERLAPAAMQELESRLKRERGSSLRDRFSETHAWRLSKLFPKLVDRAEELEIVAVDKAAPESVQKYLGEASKCFIFGQFIACALVCRSAIEFGLRNLIGEDAPDLRALIGAAREKFWTLRRTLDLADEVRIAANTAVHRAPPTEEECRDIFVKTRGVLKELYTTQDPLGPLRAQV